MGKFEDLANDRWKLASQKEKLENSIIAAQKVEPQLDKVVDENSADYYQNWKNDIRTNEHQLLKTANELGITEGEMIKYLHDLPKGQRVKLDTASSYHYYSIALKPEIQESENISDYQLVIE